MNELVERYIHQVGNYVPKAERADIEAELRSLIQDQLDDRFGPQPTQEEIVGMLIELGVPPKMAGSYQRQNYLIGPELYPYLMMTLHRVWLIIPLAVIFINLFGLLTAPSQDGLLAFVGSTLIAIVVATFITSSIVVMLFAVFQKAVVEDDKEEMTFNPLMLPKVNDPRSIDRAEVIFGVVTSVLTGLVVAYFLSVGGLTAQIPAADIIPVPTLWLALALAVLIGMFILYSTVLRRGRWNRWLWIVDTALELFGALCVYFVITEPLLEPLKTAVPALAELSFIDSVPEILVILSAVLTLIVKGSRLISLWSADEANQLPISNSTGR